MRRGRLAWALCAVVLIAGCFGSAGETGSDATTNPTTHATADDAADLRGLIVDEELRPVAGARVAVDEQWANTTDADGRFELEELPPGAHRVRVDAFGYESTARQVDLVAGQALDIQVKLDILPVREPWTEVIPVVAYTMCDGAAVVLLTPFSGVCPGSTTVHQVQINESWRYAVIELAWETSDSMMLWLDDDYACTENNPCWAMEVGSSVLRAEAAPQDPDIAREYASDGQYQYPNGSFELTTLLTYTGMYRDELNATLGPACAASPTTGDHGCYGIGMSLGIPLDLYVSVFHWERPSAPASYSAVPAE